MHEVGWRLCADSGSPMLHDLILWWGDHSPYSHFRTVAPLRLCGEQQQAEWLPQHIYTTAASEMRVQRQLMVKMRLGEIETSAICKWWWKESSSNCMPHTWLSIFQAMLTVYFSFRHFIQFYFCLGLQIDHLLFMSLPLKNIWNLRTWFLSGTKQTNKQNK